MPITEPCMEKAKNIFGIDWQKKYEEGCRGIILDIDNTLVPHDAAADTRAKAFLDNLKRMGYRLFIVSNNHEPRAKSFADSVDVPFICEALKPKPQGLLEAVRRMGLSKDQVVAVGDQIFTDAWGAKNAGIPFILTDPLDPESDTAFIKIKRILELPFR